MTGIREAAELPHAKSLEPAAATRHRFEASGLGRALSAWGRFSGDNGTQRDAAGWIGAEGELLRAHSDRTELDLLSLDAGRFVVRRTPEHTARITDIGHVVVVQLDGESVLHPADGRSPVRLGPGDLSYGDPSVPYRWEFDGPMTVMLLRLPAGILPIAPAGMRPILGTPIATDTGYGRLAVRFARDVLTDDGLLDGPSGHRILRDTVAHFETLLAGELSTSESCDPNEPAFRRALVCIEEYLAEPLTVSRIAEASGMSPRTLQELFRRRGMGVTSWVKHRRLETARLALMAPSWESADLTRIAIAHGFADHSHFTRSFRKAYGETPSAWRTRSTRSVAASDSLVPPRTR